MACSSNKAKQPVNLLEENAKSNSVLTNPCKTNDSQLQESSGKMRLREDKETQEIFQSLKWKCTFEILKSQKPKCW